MKGELFFENVRLEKDVYYFLYVGEIKGYCLNQFLRLSLEKVKKKPVDFIAVIPDIWTDYSYPNLVVLNPDAMELMKGARGKVHIRMPGRRFAAVVASHPYIRELVETLVNRQGELYLHMFQTFPEMTLARHPRVKLIGPDPELSDTWNSKLYMYEKLNGIVPVPPFRFCRSRDELLEVTGKLWNEWREGIFVSLEYSAAGAFSFLAHSQEEMMEKLGGWDPPYLITRFIPHEYDPTVLGVVASEKDVYVGCVADQSMEQLNKFRGSTYPSVLPENIQHRLKEMTRNVGREMAATGYRGIFGCDYVVDGNGEIYFVEVNARKQGTTMEMCCTLENSLPEECPNLMEIEFHAITRGQLPPVCPELSGNPGGIYWGTYNLKLDKDAVTVDTARGFPDEREMFRQVADVSGPDARFAVVEHVGKNILVKSGSFLGRVISVGKTRDAMIEGLTRGKSILKSTIKGEY